MKALFLVPLCALFASFPSFAQDKPAAGAKPAAAAQDKKETFSIVKVGDEMKVVSSTELAAMQKKADEDNKKAKEDFEKAKKDAEASKKKFDSKEPKPVTVTVEKGDFPSKDAADAALAKMKEKHDAPAGKEKPKDAKGGGEKKKEAKH